MLQQTNTRDYAKLNIHDLTKVVSVEFHKGIRETFATVNMNLEIAHKLEPYEEELEYAWANLKSMEKKFEEHIRKEEQFLFPIFSVVKKRLRDNDREIDFKNFIDSLISDHRWLKKQMEQIRKVTNQYTCEPSNTPSHKLAYAQLNDLEQDFNKMFFVEEEFLFQRALKIHGK